MTSQARTLSAVSISERLVAGGLAFLLGMTLLWGVGFAGDQALHNGAHDTRHSLGFPCH